MDRTSLRLEQDGDVSETVVATGEECLQLYDLLLSATKINHDDSNRIHLATCLCLADHLEKTQRVTRVALTLILSGQAVETMSLIREQNDFIFALN